jgi:hypothetical protein
LYNTIQVRYEGFREGPSQSFGPPCNQPLRTHICRKLAPRERGFAKIWIVVLATGQISFKPYLTLTCRNSMASKSLKLRCGVCHKKVKWIPIFGNSANRKRRWDI